MCKIFDGIISRSSELNFSHTDYCEWNCGNCIGCDQFGTIKIVDLKNKSLKGTLNGGVKKETGGKWPSLLTKLDLSWNLLEGIFPFYSTLDGSLGAYNGWETFSIAHNQFIGHVDPDWPQLEKVVNVDISYNQFEGAE